MPLIGLFIIIIGICYIYKFVTLLHFATLWSNQLLEDLVAIEKLLTFMGGLK